MNARTALLSAAVLALAASPAFAQGGANRLDAGDQAFLRQASEGSAAEVATGRLASQNAKNEAVKEFGRWMASAHGYADRELAGLAEQMHGQVPPTNLPPDAQAMVQKLQGLHGEEFDRAYLQDMIEDHQKDLAAFQKAASTVQDPLLKTFAINMVTVIQEHLQEAQDLQKDYYGGASHGAGTRPTSH